MDPLLDVLGKARAWVEAEVGKAQQPYADPFQLTSLSFAITNAKCSWEASEDARVFLRKVTKKMRSRTYDVFTPAKAIEIFDRAIAARRSASI